MIKFPFHPLHPNLFWVCITRFIFSALCFLVPPLPTPSLPNRHVAMADALLGMVKIELLLLLLLPIE
jgi:hypothetical protein